MKGLIYKIINDINNKIYVGKTTLSLEERYKIHLSDSKKENVINRPLYSAMQKYGQEHFSIHLIEECPIEILDEREQYWIKKLNSFHFGYNATLGGDGKILYNYSFIANLIKQQELSQKEIANIVGCCVDTIKKVEQLIGIKAIRKSNLLQQQMKESSIPVCQYNKDGDWLRDFSSYADAARWLYDNQIIQKLSSGVRSHIGEVCMGKRKSAYGYIWKKKE